MSNKREAIIDKLEPFVHGLGKAVLHELRESLAEPEQDHQPDNDKVICPQCCHQFRAIPVNVQTLMLQAGFNVPFTEKPQPREWQELSERETETICAKAEHLLDRNQNISWRRALIAETSATLRAKNGG